MATLGNLEKKIYTEIRRSIKTDGQVSQEDPSVSEISNAVIEAVEYYQTERFWFNEAQVSFNVSLTSVYSLATIIPGMISIDRIKVYQGSIPYVLSRSSWSNLDEVDSGNTSASIPTEYAIHHEMLRVYPTPNVTTSAVVTYHKKITLSASVSASSVWTNEAADLIKHRAKALLYASVMNDPTAAQTEHLIEKQTLNRLFARTTKIVSSNKVRGYL